MTTFNNHCTILSVGNGICDNHASFGTAGSWGFSRKSERAKVVRGNHKLCLHQRVACFRCSACICCFSRWPGRWPTRHALERKDGLGLSDYQNGTDFEQLIEIYVNPQPWHSQLIEIYVNLQPSHPHSRFIMTPKTYLLRCSRLYLLKIQTTLMFYLTYKINKKHVTRHSTSFLEYDHLFFFLEREREREQYNGSFILVHMKGNKVAIFISIEDR